MLLHVHAVSNHVWSFLSCSWALACSCCFDFGGHVATCGHMCFLSQGSFTSRSMVWWQLGRMRTALQCHEIYWQNKTSHLCLSGIGICCAEQISLIFAGIWEACLSLCIVSGIVCLIDYIYIYYILYLYLYIYLFINLSISLQYRQQSCQEEDYLPLAKEMLVLNKAFEKPHGAANAIYRQVNKPAAKRAAKAKAKAAA